MDHVLLKDAAALEEVDEGMAGALTADIIEGVIESIPLEWLAERSALDPGGARAAYRKYLVERLVPPRGFVEEAVRVR
jgi:hypothetical protein